VPPVTVVCPSTNNSFTNRTLSVIGNLSVTRLHENATTRI
jgi:hypothetical protein